jgi:hypothetical protein
MQDTPFTPQERRRDMMVGLLIIIVAFGGCMALSLWGMSRSTPSLAPEPKPPSLERLPGYPDEVDPLALIDRARGLSVRTKFRGFVATGVDSEGTVDLNTKGHSIRFSFQDPSGIGHQPPREGGTLPLRRYCGLQSVYLMKKGIYADVDQPERACPHNTPENLPIPKKCSLKDIWDIAEKRRIPASGTARVEFYDSFDGPAFRFKKDKHEFVVSADDCKRILSGRAGRGIVP